MQLHYRLLRAVTFYRWADTDPCKSWCQQEIRLIPALLRMEQLCKFEWAEVAPLYLTKYHSLRQRPVKIFGSMVDGEK